MVRWRCSRCKVSDSFPAPRFGCDAYAIACQAHALRCELCEGDVRILEGELTQ